MKQQLFRILAITLTLGAFAFALSALTRSGCASPGKAGDARCAAGAAMPGVEAGKAASDPSLLPYLYPIGKHSTVDTTVDTGVW